jgi:chorismate synthase
MFGIPACKGIEFGDGFRLAEMRGSQSNDAYRMDDGRIVTRTNHLGGIVGGMADGADVRFDVVFKPTPSIAKEQDTVSLSREEDSKVTVEGRHDPCIVPRAVAVVEAMAAITLADQLLRGFRCS